MLQLLIQLKAKIKESQMKKIKELCKRQSIFLSEGKEEFPPAAYRTSF